MCSKRRFLEDYERDKKKNEKEEEVTNEVGETTKDKKEILNLKKNYYYNLYKKRTMSELLQKEENELQEILDKGGKTKMNRK